MSEFSLKLDAFRKDLERLLINSLRTTIRLRNNSDENDAVYSAVVYCDSGFVSVGAALNTQEWLKSKIDDPDEPAKKEYLEVLAAEWKEFDFESFNELNNQIYKFFESVDESGIDLKDLDITNLFTEVIVRAIQHVNFAQILKTTYEGDLLLGMQFADPSSDQWQASLKVSEIVNTDIWHQKLKAVAQETSVG